MPTQKVLVAYFPGGNTLHPDVSDFITQTVGKLVKDPRVGEDSVRLWRRNDTPVTLSRNQCLVAAERLGMDWVLMLDNDNSPDLPGEESFWDTSWEFALAHHGPLVIAAPYGGAPPFEMPFTFRWVNRETGHANPDFQIEAVPRSEAARLREIVPAAALPTGVMLIDMRAVKLLPHPRFYYEWKGDGKPCKHCGVRKPGPQVEKASTEDISFSRDCHVAGVKLYANYRSYAGHWKPKLVGRPQLIPDDAIPAVLMERARELVAAETKAVAAPPKKKPVTNGKPAPAAARRKGKR